MPDKKERDLWWVFLAGRPESEWNPPKKPKQPKPSRWQQRTQKQQTNLQETQEDVPLPYDVSEPYGDGAAPDFGAPLPPVFPPPGGQSNQFGIDVHGTYHQSFPVPSGPPTDAMSAIEESFEIPPTYSPREPTPTLLQHMDHVRHIP